MAENCVVNCMYMYSISILAATRIVFGTLGFLAYRRDYTLKYSYGGGSDVANAVLRILAIYIHVELLWLAIAVNCMTCNIFTNFLLFSLICHHSHLFLHKK